VTGHPPVGRGVGSGTDSGCLRSQDEGPRFGKNSGSRGGGGETKKISEPGQRRSLGSVQNEVRAKGCLQFDTNHLSETGFFRETVRTRKGAPMGKGGKSESLR